VTAIPTHALHAYLDHGRITNEHDAHHTKSVLLGDWWAAMVRGDDAVMLAGRRADVAEMNLRGHVCADAAGYLDGPSLEVGGAPIRAGDKVMMLRNDRKLGVRNGNTGGHRCGPRQAHDARPARPPRVRGARSLR
jgi:ATP-dependent exoDNAse (exonuclease V) alpha subunit